MTLPVQIRDQQIVEVERLLSGVKNGAKRALTRALNRTLKSAETQTSKEVRKVITLKAKDVNKYIKSEKANFSKINARLRVTGTRIPLLDYGAKKLARGGISVKVRKNKKTEKYPHAFMATMKSSHNGVYERRLIKGTGRRVRRLPIDEKFGPSVPAVFQFNAERNVRLSAADNLQKNLNSEINYLLNIKK